ncbi:DgyrCDS7571 [Dimorphilus gyrociliatus]|uniref:Lysosome-associated membrane glycoprotein 5 n=1 Tax=Dimorphilus gyrociliatus TaxID=2664684 RepID=A0A7I8VRE4_9ANNE|nr:DgyrCDS7571 [Dimorphilus gyrociliatus]
MSKLLSVYCSLFVTTGLVSIGQTANINIPVSTAVPTTDSGTPIYSLKNKDGKICFKAAFDSEVHVRFKPDNTTKEKTVVVKVPADASATGKCDEYNSALTLKWSKYSLKFSFQKKAANLTTKKHKATQLYYSNGVNFTINTTNNSDFPDLRDEGTKTLEKKTKQVGFIVSPSNQSYSCVILQKYTLKLPYLYKKTSQFKNAKLHLKNVRFQPFNVPESGKFLKSHDCPADVANKQAKQNIVPLVVASSLGIFIIIIIFAYFISKTLNKPGYKAVD